jgi:hypothetical protein
MAKFRKQVIEYLKKAGGDAIPVENIASPGTPDVNCFLKGEEYWIELKDEEDKLRASQLLWIKNRIRAGGRVWVLYRRGNRCLLVHGAHCQYEDWMVFAVRIPLDLEGLDVEIQRWEENTPSARKAPDSRIW